mgnify:CR=1 FL=1
MANTKSQRKVKMTKSQFAEKFLYLNGRQLSLSDYPHLRAIYDSDAKDTVLQFSRQTAKSTTLANLKIANCAMRPYFKSLYIAPTVDQCKVFSHDRVAPVIESSPLIKQHYINSSLVQNVHMKQFLNGSKLYLRYALVNADRIRGYSADMNLFDEAQDLAADIIPVVRETMSRSMYKKTMYAGTPKRTRGTLADIWERSTKNEFMPRCTGCGKWNLLDEKNIGNLGVICKYCGKLMDIKSGRWVQTGEEDATVEGWRVCLLHFSKAPWVDWQKDVIEKMKITSKAIFYNETLALAFDDGVAPVTRSQVKKCCTGPRISHGDPDLTKDSINAFPRILGIDYGPVNSDSSNTVISIVQKRGPKFHVLYAKKFLGKEADYAFIHDEVPRIMNKWGAEFIASDYGMGEAPNSEFRRRLGYEKVIAFQHMPNQKKVMEFNSKMPAYTLGRNQVMNMFFQRIKSGAYIFPEGQEFDTFVDDMLNVQNEYNEEMNTMKYVNIGPDDFVHATIFASLSAELYSNAQL